MPAGFVTGLDSVPRWPIIFWLFKGVGGDEPGALHDWLYTSREVSRKRADEVFAESMKVKGALAWRRGPVWAAVRVGGAAHWDEKPTKSETPLQDIYFG